MGNHNRKMKTGTVAIIAVLVTCLVGVGIWVAYNAITGSMGAGVFSIAAEDRQTGRAIPDADVDAALYGVTHGEDPTVWGSYVLLDTVTDLSDITDADLDTDLYDEFWVRASADNRYETWRDYASLWMKLDADGANVIEMTQTPTDNGAVLFSEAFAANTVNMTQSETDWSPSSAWDACNVVGNFSVVLGINATESGKAGYVSYFDPQFQLTAKLFLVFNFNTTIGSNNNITLVDSTGDSWVKSAATYNSTAIAYECLDCTGVSTLTFAWNGMASTGWTLRNYFLIWEPTVTTGATTVLFRSG